MATNPNDTHARKAVGKFARALLATTCLTVASGAASASTLVTYIEGTSPAPATFANTFAGASASALPAATYPGTTIIDGEVTGSDRTDYIELTGLGTGPFTVDAVDTSGGAADITLYNDLVPGGTNIGGPTPFNTSIHADFAAQPIPLDGDLVIEIFAASENPDIYSVTVTTAPEPGTLATAGFGLAGAVALARRRRKQS